jgi:hypothetical protein
MIKNVAHVKKLGTRHFDASINTQRDTQVAMRLIHNSKLLLFSKVVFTIGMSISHVTLATESSTLEDEES